MSRITVHPAYDTPARDNDVAVLAQQLPLLKAQGVEVIDLPQMIALRANQAMAGHGRDGRYR